MRDKTLLYFLRIRHFSHGQKTFIISDSFNLPIVAKEPGCTVRMDAGETFICMVLQSLQFVQYEWGWGIADMDGFVEL